MASESCLRFSLLFLLLTSMAALIVALMTDYWYDVECKGLVTAEESHRYNYRFGLWRMCFRHRPASMMEPDVELSGENCIWIFKDLIPKNEKDLSSDHKLRLHLMRSVLGLSIASAGCLLSALICLVCAWVPGNCKPLDKSRMYIGTLLIVVLALMTAIASGICFMAARDVEKKELDMYSNLRTEYNWSFGVHWAGTGLMLVAGCQLLYMLTTVQKDLSNKKQSYYYYNS